MDKYGKIVGELIRKSFSELKNEKIKVIEYPNWLIFWTNGFVYKLPFSWCIFINKTERGLSRKALVGLLAHELCHIAQDKKIIKSFLFGFFQSLFVDLSWAFDTPLSRKVERTTDLLTIKKGYGKELLELALLQEKKNSEEKSVKAHSRGYLTPKQIKQEMKKLR